MKTLASIILFNPTISRLEENVNSIINQVDAVLLIDNNSVNSEKLNDFVLKYGTKLHQVVNSQNMGIAYALNQAFKYAIDNSYDWVLTLDQDTVCYPNLVKSYLGCLKLNKVGILTSIIKDRNFSIGNTQSFSDSYRKIKQCITAGSFCSVKAYQETDGFNNELFIDAVDFDYCANLGMHGFNIYQLNFIGILQEVGHGRNVHLLNREYITYNHSPFRQYYMARNHFYLAKKYPHSYPLRKEFFHEMRNWLLIMLFEKNRYKKIKARLKGVHDSSKLSI